MARGDGGGYRRPRAGARPFSDANAHQSRPPKRRVSSLFRQHRLHQHHPPLAANPLARRPRIRGQNPLLHSLERPRNGGARQPQARRPRRTHCQFRLLGRSLRCRLQSFFSRTHARCARRRRRLRRPDLFSRPFRPRHLRPRLFGGAHQRKAVGKLSLRNRRRRPVVLSPSVADARLLAIPHRFHGAGADSIHLSGAIHALFGKPRPDSPDQPQSVGVCRRRRNGRARIAGRNFSRHPRGAWTILFLW